MCRLVDRERPLPSFGHRTEVLVVPQCLYSQRLMTPFAKTLIRTSVVLGLLAAGLVLTSCDLASAGNTAILNANSTIPPIVRHRFEYTGDDVTDGGQVEALSSLQSDDLDAILSENLGASRTDVVSARVDSVSVERLSTNTLSGVLYLGTDAGGPRIANVQLDSGEETTARNTRVTDAVKSGQERVFAEFDAEDSSSGGMVRAVVYYQLEVEGI